MKDFFYSHPNYKRAPAFCPPTFRDASILAKQFQGDDGPIRKAANEYWKLFDPALDNRLSYVIDFWRSLGFRMDGTLESLEELDRWVVATAREWRDNNPRPDFVERLGASEEIAVLHRMIDELEKFESFDSSLISLARDMCLYQALCISSITGYDGEWVKWNNHGEIGRPYPVYELNLPFQKYKPAWCRIYTFIGWLKALTHYYNHHCAIEENGVSLSPTAYCRQIQEYVASKPS